MPTSPSPSPRPRSQYLTAPPRSPRPNSDVQEVEIHSSSPKVNSEFKLDTTPRRRLQPNQKSVGDTLGLGTGMSSRRTRVEDE
jgi:hypothetical protein